MNISYTTALYERPIYLFVNKVSYKEQITLHLHIAEQNQK